MFNKYNVLGFLLIISLVNSQECFDYELAESDFPFSHLADFTSEEDIGQYWGMEFLGDGLLGAAGGNDFAYKLTLLEPALVYITTCDSETDVDVEIAIYNSCDSTDWILYQDDSNLSVFYPDGSSEQYDFQCISGYEENPTFANMLPRLDWEAGTYYIVVSDRGYSGTVKTYIGYSLLVDSTTTNSDYTEINYHFSEGVFGGEYQDVYNGNGIALEANDYSLSIDSNGGDADEAYIISLSTMLGEELTGDERNIKINIDYPDTPSGVEQVTIGPASVSSIFNSIGIPLLDIDGITIELVDAQRPLITSIEPSDNSISVPANSNILLTFSESVFFNDNEITNENASNCFKIENIETNENLAFELSNFENIIFTLNPENNFPEFSYIRCIIFSSIEDLNNNQFVTDTVTFRTEDLTPPTIINSSLINTNEYGILSFNESVYSTNSGSGSLSITDFTLTFNSNNGNCTNVTLSGLTNNEGGGIEGGESMFRVLIQLEGAPSGVETFFLSPINNSSIYDFAGNAMLSSSTSSELTLFASASIDTFSIADSNEYVDLTFSSGIYGDNNQIQAVSVSDFNFQLNSNGGAVSSGGITHISNINNGQLSGGDQIIRLFMTFDTLPSGVETILISPVSDNSIYSLSGVPLPSSENTGLIILADQRPPEGELSIFNGQTEVIESDPLRITFSEDIYNPNTGQIITSEELIEFITLRIGDENGEDIPFLVNYSSPPDLYIVPNEDFASDEIVYYSFNGLLEDASGNPVLFNLYATFSIRDYLPPAIDSSRLALDNSYVDLFFDDEIFGGVEFDGENYFGISPVDRNDFDIQFESNGSETDSVVITSITRTDSNFLIGGEKEIRVNFEYNGTPDGNETLRIIVQSGVIIYDEVANQMTDTVTIMQQERLYDLLAPTINYISMQTDSLITLVEERNIIFTFNELVDSICYSINSNATGIIKADSCYIVSDSFITVSMNPPFASYDQIGINFSYLEDITGLTTVDIAYTYHTPILGDYDYDNALTYNDLWDLVENWEINNMDFELGPVDGEVPNLIPYLDSKFDIEDGMAFVQMWSWYQKEFGEIIEDTTQVGGTLNLNKRNKKYTIILDDSISAGKIKFTYDEDFQPIRFLDYPNKNKKIFIESHQPDKGFSVLEFARSGILNEDSILFEIDKNSSLKLFYSLKSSRKILSKQGMIELNNSILPEKINLYPIYPNPFNPFATITFDIPKNMSDADVMLKIYDIKGREISNIINSKMNPGTYSFQWNGSGYSSGMYIVKLLIDSNKMTQKIILLK